jgi:hypothetical protein
MPGVDEELEDMLSDEEMDVEYEKAIHRVLNFDNFKKILANLESTEVDAIPEEEREVL